MKKICKVILAVAAVVALAAPAMAADKLIVKNAGTVTGNAVQATDAGVTGFNAATPRYAGDFAAPNSVMKAVLHFKHDGADNGGYLTSVLENNFFVSSGAVFDLDAGGWIQKSSDGCSVYFGSGGVGFRAFTQCGAYAVGDVITAPQQSFLLDYSANMAIGGGLMVNALAQAKPACNAANGPLIPGMIWYTAGAAGVKDSVQVCAKDATNTWNWRVIY